MHLNILVQNYCEWLRIQPVDKNSLNAMCKETFGAWMAELGSRRSSQERLEQSMWVQIPLHASYKFHWKQKYSEYLRFHPKKFILETRILTKNFNNDFENFDKNERRDLLNALVVSMDGRIRFKANAPGAFGEVHVGSNPTPCSLRFLYGVQSICVSQRRDTILLQPV